MTVSDDYIKRLKVKQIEITPSMKEEIWANISIGVMVGFVALLLLALIFVPQ